MREFRRSKEDSLQCRCGEAFFIDDAEYVRPSLQEWIEEGLDLDAKGRAWINKRFALDTLGKNTNIVNARMCWWPSYDGDTISVSQRGTHLLDLLSETRPAVVVAYNQDAGDLLRREYSVTFEDAHEFFTSTARKRHVVRWSAPTSERFGLIVGSQAQDAPHAADAAGITMRVWTAQRAASWLESHNA